MSTAEHHSRATCLSVAPMMDWTDRHCRYFHRLLSKKVLLYTEMIASAALIRGQALNLLDFSAEEHPVALQLGGSDPKELAMAAKLAEQVGYCEVNLNVGCPSDRVQSGSFGAVLMKTPEVVAECCDAMRAAVNIEITVKCRIGIDDQEPSDVLPDFLEKVSASGVSRFIIHARKAVLNGLTPKENRKIPPLDYELVHTMKAMFPELDLSLNGGIGSLTEAKGVLDSGLDGVMIGRAAYKRPYDILAGVDADIFGEEGRTCAKEVVHQMVPYIEQHIKEGGKLNQITRHMLGLFAGQGGARVWRRLLSERGHLSGVELVLEALHKVDRATSN